MMTNRNRWIVGLLAITPTLTSRCLHGADATPPAKANPATTIAPPAVAYLGVSSCASVACHGGPVSSPAKWQSAYTVWVTKDRHAKAYSVLWEPRSKEIARALGGADRLKEPQAWNDARCLVCHSLHGTSTDVGIVSDGVSCEACHGAAGGWLVPHTTAAWRELPSEKKHAPPFRFENTKNLIARGEVCIVCHVGQSTSEGNSKDVTHELIAAGHPRLAFEFSAYMANLPAHWSPPAHAARGEASAWAMGQALCARAAEQLRTAHASAGSVEFADYDCFACHHDLHGDSWRQTDTEAGRGPSSAPGALRLSTWYTGMFRRVQTISKLDLKSTPATQAAKALETWIDGQDAAGLRHVMTEIAAQGTQAAHWDDATQCYLALLALDNARRADGKSPGGEASENDQRIRESIQLLNQELTFPKNLNSPRNYDPGQFRIELGNLSELLSGKKN